MVRPRFGQLDYSKLYQDVVYILFFLKKAALKVILNLLVLTVGIAFKTVPILKLAAVNAVTGRKLNRMIKDAVCDATDVKRKFCCWLPKRIFKPLLKNLLPILILIFLFFLLYQLLKNLQQ